MLANSVVVAANSGCPQAEDYNVEKTTSLVWLARSQVQGLYSTREATLNCVYWFFQTSGPFGLLISFWSLALLFASDHQIEISYLWLLGLLVGNLRALAHVWAAVSFKRSNGTLVALFSFVPLFMVSHHHGSLLVCL